MAAPIRCSKCYYLIKRNVQLTGRCLYRTVYKKPDIADNKNVLAHEIVESHRKSKLSHTREVEQDHDITSPPSKDFRDVYPDFLPNPWWQYRDRIAEKLEREDMYRRRMHLNIPEFYVGSVIAVTVADEYAPGKTNRFLGICISRGGNGLRSYFILRNIIDDEGIEIMYEMYNPVVQNIEIIKLEKRLDDELFYLRDAPHEHSYFPLDMAPVMLPKGSVVPLNAIKIKLNPRPWDQKWERQHLRGILDVESQVTQKRLNRAAKSDEPWLKWDMMREYRSQVNDVDVAKIEEELMKRKKDIDQIHGDVLGGVKQKT